MSGYVAFSPEKMKNAILFFVQNARNLGKTKLAKLLFFADFQHYAEHGRSITGEGYMKRDYGPLASQLQPVLQQMKEEGLLDWRTRRIVDYFGYEYTPHAEADERVFSDDELATLREVAARWQYASASRVVDESHSHPAWVAAKSGDLLDYRLAVCSPEPEPEDDQLRRSKILAELVRRLP